MHNILKIVHLILIYIIYNIIDMYMYYSVCNTLYIDIFSLNIFTLY